MSSVTINQAMDTDNWDTVRDLLIIKPSLSKKELENKYGVSSEHTAKIPPIWIESNET